MTFLPYHDEIISSGSLWPSSGHMEESHLQFILHFEHIQNIMVHWWWVQKAPAGLLKQDFQEYHLITTSRQQKQRHVTRKLLHLAETGKLPHNVVCVCVFECRESWIDPISNLHLVPWFVSLLNVLVRNTGLRVLVSWCPNWYWQERPKKPIQHFVQLLLKHFWWVVTRDLLAMFQGQEDVLQETCQQNVFTNLSERDRMQDCLPLETDFILQRAEWKLPREVIFEWILKLSKRQS